MTKRISFLKINFIALCLIALCLPLPNAGCGIFSGKSGSVPIKKGGNILYLGDSLSYGNFGIRMDEGLTAMGYKVFISVTGGGSPYYWLSSETVISSNIGYWEKTPYSDYRTRYKKAVPKLDYLIKKFNPQLVIIQTGTNLYSTLKSKRHSMEYNRNKIERLVTEMCATIKAYGAASYWITPPDSHDKKYPTWLKNELASIIKKVAKKYGGYFESHKYTKYTNPYPKYDGIHYSPDEYDRWASKVLANFQIFARNNKSSNNNFVKAKTRKPITNKQNKIAKSQESKPITITRKSTEKNELKPQEKLNSKKNTQTYSVAQNQKSGIKANRKNIQDIDNSKVFAKIKKTDYKKDKTIHSLKEINELELSDNLLDIVYNKNYNFRKNDLTPYNISQTKEQNLKNTKPNENLEENDAYKNVNFTLTKKPITVTIKLLKKSDITNVNEVVYRRAFAVYEFQVIKVEKGDYPFDKIRVAQMAVMNRRFTGVHKRKIGSVISLELVPLQLFPKLKTVEIFDDLPQNISLPIYITKFY